MDYNYLKNNRNLKAFFKDATSEELEGIIHKLNELYTEIKNKEIEEEQAKKRKEEFLSNLLNKLDEQNLTVDDLATLKELQKKDTRQKMAPKYEYTALDGKTYLWSGKGKIPKLLREVMQRDGITDKNHYLIK